MFNTYSSSANIKINACSGGIYKTYKESWFNRFNLKSELAEKILKPYDNKVKVNIEGYHYIEKEVIILQMIICGDMEVIAELIKKEDFDKYFEIKESE